MTEPATDFVITVQFPGSDEGAAKVLDLDPAKNIQVARLHDQSPSGTNQLWWSGAQREVQKNAVLVTYVALAGGLRCRPPRGWDRL